MVAVEAQVSGLLCFVSTEIPEIAKVTEKIVFINLENNIKTWTEIIFNHLKNTNRKNTNFTDVLKKYDIKLEACKLEKKYLKKAK